MSKDRLKKTIYLYLKNDGQIFMQDQGEKITWHEDKQEWIEIEHTIDVPLSLFEKPKIVSETMLTTDDIKKEKLTIAQRSSSLGGAEFRG